MKYGVTPPFDRLRVQGDRFVLNGRPLALRMVLDQGYWPDTGPTAPDDGLCGEMSNWRRRWVSTVSESTRRSRTRDTSTGPTRWVSWCGKRCPAPTDSTPTSVERLTARMD